MQAAPAGSLSATAAEAEGEPDGAVKDEDGTWTGEAEGSMQAVKLVCCADTVDNLVDALLSFGATSCSMEDANLNKPGEQEIFQGPQPWNEDPRTGPVEKWKQSAVTALFPLGFDIAEAMERVQAALDLKKLPKYEVTQTVDQDWVQAIKDCYQPVQVAPKLWIVPSWSQPEDPEAVNVLLEPGLAFGTGDHPTTRLCLQFLRSAVKGGENVMDYGTGSGILAVAALKLGAAQAVGVDTDPQALTSARHNLSLNGFDNSSFALFLPSELNGESKERRLPKEGEFDIVLANILIGPLLQLKERIVGYAKPGGKLALSGVLEEQVEEVREAYSEYLTDISVEVDNNWACIVGSKLKTL